MSDCRFNASQNGRRLAARRLGPVVLWPIFPAVSGGIFSACPNTGSYSRGTSLAALATEATSDARIGCKSTSSRHVPQDQVELVWVLVAWLSDYLGGRPPLCVWVPLAEEIKDVLHIYGRLVVPDVIPKLSVLHHLINVAIADHPRTATAIAAVGVGDSASISRDFLDFLFDRVHFGFPFLGLSAPCLILPTTYHHADTLSTPQKRKNARFFIGRNRRHLRRAVARTQNASPGDSVGRRPPAL